MIIIENKFTRRWCIKYFPQNFDFKGRKKLFKKFFARTFRVYRYISHRKLDIYIIMAMQR